MDDVITIFSSPIPTRHHSPLVDLGVIEITDSEPEDPVNDDPFRTDQNEGDPKLSVSPHRTADILKEHSPMDVDIPSAEAGPSTRLPVPDPFPDTPIVHIQRETDPQEVNTDLFEKHLALILEVIPDVLPEHAMSLVERLYPIHRSQVAERVVQDLFDSPSYPKVEKAFVGKGKGKRKASEMEDALGAPPSRVKIDFASVDRPKPAGKNYTMLSLVSCPFAHELQLLHPADNQPC
jgi:hypothetical protein